MYPDTRGAGMGKDMGINYWSATDFLPRDQRQSRLLHEPNWMITSIDPITGEDITGLAGRPQVVDGKVTMYFESEETRRAYLDTSTKHSIRLPDNPDEEGEAEG